MTPRTYPALRERGAALILLAMILVLGTSWAVVAALNNRSGNRIGAEREYNAKVLAEAKAALIGWVATQALESGEGNPGRLPCPEPGGHVGNGSYEGISAPYPPSGQATCSSVGRFPWRTLGVQKPLDAAGEPLWYVVTIGSAGWALQTSATKLMINSDKPGGLAVNGVANAAVAAIIAPGRPMRLNPNAGQTAAGCIPRTQARGVTPPNYLDYLECHDIASGNIRTIVPDNATNEVANDQVALVTVADVLPALEAAIAKRIERDIVPQLKAVYADAGAFGTSASNPVYPFAAPFGRPDTATYQGSSGTLAGLLPFTYLPSGICTTDPRCNASLHTWGTPSFAKIGGTASLWPWQVCTEEQTTVGGTSYKRSFCYGWYQLGSLVLSYDDRISNIGNALRSYTLADYTTTLPPDVRAYNYNTGTWSIITPAQSRRLNADGSMSFALTATLPNVSGWGYFEFRTTRPAFSNHPLLTDTNPTTGWFVRNEWYRLLYYAIAPEHAPGGVPPCTPGVSCVEVANLADAARHRAVLALAGRALASLGQTRPSSDPRHYLDVPANYDGASPFVQHKVSRTYNDRFISVDKNP